ncbi:hypothetical protein KO498_12730 [Lentibacter algarum]|uniref:hypothetical protein n=1 Tax=Lentibacter algarum TaxID=576131 RepID=UPI001C083FCF|nr:hypothetical protein [Lentibacter algarum]MBU2982674.1 hypothetical protein [Lentibacter algarum]
MRSLLTLAVFMTLALPAAAQSVRFGDNQSEWARDGECDDRRFTGYNMATELDQDDTLHDAADCRKAFQQGQITLIDPAAAKAATVCTKIDFGRNRGEWANDSECDDYRFDGEGMATVIRVEEIKTDANDCRALCGAGMIYLRQP